MPEAACRGEAARFRDGRFQAGKYVVMRVVGGQVQAEVEASRVQQPQQRGEGRLPLVTFVR